MNCKKKSETVSSTHPTCKPIQNLVKCVLHESRLIHTRLSHCSSNFHHGKHMDAYEKKLHQRDKATLIAIIKRMLHLQPDLAWVLDTAQPVPTQGPQTFNPAPYRQRIQAAITAASET
jgi:hypothetical protein